MLILGKHVGEHMVSAQLGSPESFSSQGGSAPASFLLTEDTKWTLFATALSARLQQITAYVKELKLYGNM